MAEQEEVLEQASEGTEAAQPEVVEIGEGENFSRQQVEEIVKSALEKEITGLKHYSNFSLANKPFSEWKDDYLTTKKNY